MSRPDHESEYYQNVSLIEGHLHRLTEEQRPTLRDWFAAHAPDRKYTFSLEQGRELLGGRRCPNAEEDYIGALQWSAEVDAAIRYIHADAMLREREKGGK